LPKTTPIINSLNGGEIDRRIDARVDFNKYFKACRTLLGEIPLVEGGVIRTPGTYFVWETKDSSKVSRLIPFHFSTEQAYQMEVGDFYIRFYKNQGLIAIDDSMDDFNPAAAFFVGEYTKLGSYSALNAGGGTKYLYVASPYGQTGDTGLTVACVSAGADTMTVTKVGAAITINLANATPAKNAANLIQVALRALGTVNSIDVSAWTVTENPPYAAARPTAGVNIAGAAMTNLDKAYQCTATSPIPTSAYNTNYFPFAEASYWTERTVGDPVEIVTDYAEDEVFDIKGPQGADTLYLYYEDNPPMKLVRHSHINWELIEQNCVASPFKSITNISNTGTAIVTCVDHGLPAWAYIYIKDVEGMIEVNDLRFLTQPIDSDTFYLNGVNSTTYASYISGGKIYVGITGITQAATAVVTMARHGRSNGEMVKIEGVLGMTKVNGNIYEVANRTNTTFELKDCNSTAYGAYTGGGTALKKLFTQTGDYPSCGTFFEQRSYKSGCKNHPQTIYGSSVAEYENHGENPSDESAAIEYTIPGAQNRVDRIRWLSPEDFLIIGTAGSIQKMGASSIAEPLSATNVSVRQQVWLGVSNVDPQPVTDSLVWLTRAGTSVRKVTWSSDSERYVAPNLTRIAGHITYGDSQANSGIKQFAFQREPMPILWAVRNDGQLLGMTYEIAEEVYAWFRIVTDGIFESVSVISADGEENEVWVIVNRTIGGVTKRYVEFFKPINFFSEIKNAFFVHSGLTWDGGEFDITGISKANPAVVTAPGHTFTAGYKVRITGALGMEEVNCDADDYYTIANPSGDTFELSGVNSLSYTAYSGGGLAGRVTNTLSGLSHLEGKTVSVLGDGVDFGDEVVAGGAITLDHYGNLIHVGLPFESVIEPMKLHSGSTLGTARSKKQRINKVTVCVYETCGGKIGPDEDNLQDISGYFEKTYDEGELITADADVEFDGDWKNEATLCLKQDRPYPFGILALIPRVSLNEEE